MTRLYFADPYTTTFDAQITGREESPDGPTVLLDRTYFYPESGGQPFDLGSIGGVPVVKVIEANDVVRHVLERFPEKDEVHCVIDAERRRDHMQQHSGQHILSAALLNEAGAQTLSFWLGRRTSTIDVDRAPLPLEAVTAAVREANRVVQEGRPIRSFLVSEGEARELELRKAPEVEGTLRIVEVEGFDRQACCGTHARNAAEVGPILVRSFERFKSGTRVGFVCGTRALEDYAASVLRLQTLSRVLSAPEDELAAIAEKLLTEKANLVKSHEALREELLESRARSWIASTEAAGDVKLIVREVPDVNPGELRVLAHALTRERACVALLGARADGRAHLVFARSSDVARDMAALLKQVLAAVDGRGGGTAQIAQGGGQNLDGLAAALAAAKKELSVIR